MNMIMSSDEIYLSKHMKNVNEYKDLEVET